MPMSTSVTSPNFVVSKTKPHMPVEPIFRIQKPPSYNDMDTVKRLLESHQHHNMTQQMDVQESRQTNVPMQGLMPIVKDSRSLAAEARSVLKDGGQSTNALEASIIADYNKILQGVQTRRIQDILQDMLCRKPSFGEVKPNLDHSDQGSNSANNSPKQQQPAATINHKPEPVQDDANNLPSFLQYIGKELEKLPFDSQERAKREIFRVVSELKKQSSIYIIPHHWQLSQPSAKDMTFISK